MKNIADNAFDAQASGVTVVFDSKRQKITIIDDWFRDESSKDAEFLWCWSDNCEEDENIDGKFGVEMKMTEYYQTNKLTKVSTNHDGKSIFAFIDYQKIFERKVRYDNNRFPLR